MCPQLPATAPPKYRLFLFVKDFCFHFPSCGQMLMLRPHEEKKCYQKRFDKWITNERIFYSVSANQQCTQAVPLVQCDAARALLKSASKKKNQRLKSLRSVLFRKFEDFGKSWSFEGTRNKFSVNFNVRRCRATMDTPLRSYEQTLMVMGSNLAPGWVCIQ